jgi:hypothetical protein
MLTSTTSSYKRVPVAILLIKYYPILFLASASCHYVFGIEWFALSQVRIRRGIGRIVSVGNHVDRFPR